MVTVRRYKTYRVCLVVLPYLDGVQVRAAFGSIIDESSGLVEIFLADLSDLGLHLVHDTTTLRHGGDVSV